MTEQAALDQQAEALFTALAMTHQTLVLAESCTGGLIAATLAGRPGISAWFAGSLVVYQIESKVQWLGVPQALIDSQNVVSEQVAVSMAERALAVTPHASVSLGITGHLGPGAPAELDGAAWLAIAGRAGVGLTRRLQLTAAADCPAADLRRQRQRSAALQSMKALCQYLQRRTE